MMSVTKNVKNVLKSSLRASAVRQSAAKSTMADPDHDVPYPELESFWMPFTDNRDFKRDPRLVASAKGNTMTLTDGREILDGISGLWTTNAGHCQPKIIEAIQHQCTKLDFASNFNMGHELPFPFADRLLDLLPNRGFGKVFFTMCGSSAVDSALKMALAYHTARGEGQRTRFIGRQRGYHGVGIGGISVGCITPNRKVFSGMTMPNTSHLSHTHDLKRNAYSKGQPEHGADFADELEVQIAMYGADTIAAVIVEPVSGSTGVLPPPNGYLKRLREITQKHGILLIFDEVITGFGRLGKSFATEYFDVTPDMITCAKGLTNGAVPAGALICKEFLHDTIVESANRDPGSTIEFFHGYTYSGHPLAMAAGIATLDCYEEQGLFDRSAELAPYFEEGIHALKGLPNVVDIRNCGLMGAVELTVDPAKPFKRSTDVFERCFADDVLVRHSGSAIAIAPSLITEKAELDRIFETVAKNIKASAEAF
jgi:beta-alanine--pyruvate transaminase